MPRGEKVLKNVVCITCTSSTILKSKQFLINYLSISNPIALSFALYLTVPKPFPTIGGSAVASALAAHLTFVLLTFLFFFAFIRILILLLQLGLSHGHVIVDVLQRVLAGLFGFIFFFFVLCVVLLAIVERDLLALRRNRMTRFMEIPFQINLVTLYLPSQCPSWRTCRSAAGWGRRN